MKNDKRNVDYSKAEGNKVSQEEKLVHVDTKHSRKGGSVGYGEGGSKPYHNDNK